MTTRSVLALSLAAVVTLSGCAVPTLTTMRANIATSDEYRYEVVQEKVQQHLDDTFLAATFSGGGMRAATLAYGALRTLRATRARSGNAGAMRRDRSISLIEEFDLVSSVSGGSLTAAYWALHGPDELDGLETEFLRQDVEQQLFNRAFSPLTLLRLPLPDYSRIDVLRQRFEAALGDATYAELLERTQTHRNRPYLVINAANMTTGYLFPFAQLHFDLICSDLSAFKVADAVAASAAYPVWFNSLNLTNHRTEEILCLGEGLSGELARQESEAQGRVDKLVTRSNEAHRRVEEQQQKLGLAEREVRTRTIEKAKAQALRQAKKSQVDEATAEVRALTLLHQAAVGRVKSLESELDAAEREHQRSTKERDEEQARQLERKARYEARLHTERNRIEELQQGLENARARAREKGTTFTDWLRSLLPSDRDGPSPGEDTAEERQRPEVHADNRSEARDGEGASSPQREVDGEGGDDRRSHYEEALRTLTKWWRALEETGLQVGEFVFGGETGSTQEAHRDPSSTTPEDAGPGPGPATDRAAPVGRSDERAPEPDRAPSPEPGRTTAVDGSQRPDDEAGDVRSSAASSLEKARQQIAAVSDELSRLQARFAELQRDAVSESADLVGHEGLETDLRTIDEQVSESKARLRSLESPVPDASPPAGPDPAHREAELAILMRQAQGLHDTVVSDPGLRSRLEELHWEHAHRMLRIAQERIAEEQAHVQRGIELLEAEHAEDRAKADATLADLRRKVDAARDKVARLEEALRKAERLRNRLRRELDEHLGDVAERKRELAAAEAVVRARANSLSKAERSRDDIGRELESVREEQADVARRLKRLRALERERASASDGYRAQLSHYASHDARHVHVIDGGAADNLGFTPLLELLDSWFTKPDGSTQAASPDAEHKVSHVGVVAVDARSAPVRDYETTAVSPGIIDTIVATVSTAIDSKSFLLASELGNVTRRLQDDGAVVRRHIVNVGFADIADFHVHAGAPAIAHVHGVEESSAHADEIEHAQDRHPRYVDGKWGRVDLEQCRREFQRIPTTWSLSNSRTEAVIAMGEALVRDSRAYRSLVGEFGGTIPPGNGTVADVCASHVDHLISARQ